MLTRFFGKNKFEKMKFLIISLFMSFHSFAFDMNSALTKVKEVSQDAMQACKDDKSKIKACAETLSKAKDG